MPQGLKYLNIQRLFHCLILPRAAAHIDTAYNHYAARDKREEQKL